MNFYKKYMSKPYSFLMIDTALVSVNHLRFKKLLQEEYKNQSWQLIIRLEIKTTYDFNREAAKISALSLGKIDKYEYLAGEEILQCIISRLRILVKTILVVLNFH